MPIRGGSPELPSGAGTRSSPGGLWPNARRSPLWKAGATEFREDHGSAPMSEFPLQSGEAGQAVGAFVEEVTGVGLHQFPFDVFPNQERIGLFYQVVVLQWAAISWAFAVLSPPVEQIGEDVYCQPLRLDQKRPVGMRLDQHQHRGQFHAVVGGFRMVSPPPGPFAW